MSTEMITQAEQVWNASGHDAWVQDMSHWRGHGRWADDEAWLEIGRSSFRDFLAVLRVFLPEVATQVEAADGVRPLFEGSLLEWGPGGGSNLIALGPLFERTYGVDISVPNLMEARKQTAAAGVTTFEPVHLSGDPEGIVSKIETPVDLFLSTAVFQHFPGKDYAGQVLRTAFEVMSGGALGLVQVRYDDGRERYQQKQGDYASQCVTYTSFALDEFCLKLEVAGFQVMDIRIVDPTANYALYVFRKPL